jgi:hypothetical protein
MCIHTRSIVALAEALPRATIIGLKSIGGVRSLPIGQLPVEEIVQRLIVECAECRDGFYTLVEARMEEVGEHPSFSQLLVLATLRQSLGEHHMCGFCSTMLDGLTKARVMAAD